MIRDSFHLYESHLTNAFAERPAFRQEFEVTAPGVVKVALDCETKHRGIVNGVIVVAARIKYRKASTQAGLATAPLSDIPGAVGGGNIYNITDHYHTLHIGGNLPVAPGWYRFEVHMCSDSSIPHTDGTCGQISNQSNPAPSPTACYNRFTTEEKPGETYGYSAS